MKPLDATALAGLPLPAATGGKEERGRVLVVGGGTQAPGGVLLAGLAALRVGAGKLQIATAHTVAPALAVATPEALVIGTPGEEPGPASADLLRPKAGHCDGLIIGPGMLDEAGGGQLALALAAAPGKARVLIDAAALTGLAGHEGGLDALAGRLVLTPHAGEMASLLGRDKAAVEADPQAHALEAARLWSAVVALKGQETWIVTPGGEVWRHDGGLRGLGTSGSGDVLAGAIGGLLARGADPLTATAWGVVLHAAAGRRLAETIGPLGFLARELLDVLPAILHEHGGAPV